MSTSNTDTTAGRVALITGANTGIGRETAIALALDGWHVFLACRSAEKTRPVLDEIARRSSGSAKAEFLSLDLGDLTSVRACADAFLQRNLPLQLLINNAGLAGSAGMTASGFELTFGVCHIGHFLLTQLLLPRLKASAPARIVVVSSKAHRHCKAIDFDALKKPTSSVGGLREYAVAKMANLLFVKGLAKRLAGSGVTAYALHPGVVGTDVWRSLPWPLDAIIKRFMITPQQGAATTLYCALDASVASESGFYYDNCRQVRHSRLGDDAALAAELWKRSEEWVL